jgi:hypothetical protein
MSVLKASPFNLVLAEEVVARVAVTNLIGTSSFSEESIINAQIQSEPSSPSSTPSRGTSTSTSQIYVMIEALTGLNAGDATVYSYQIDISIDQVTWTALKGYSTNDVSLSFVKTGLTISVEYSFRYRARNIHGWGQYSEVS